MIRFHYSKETDERTGEITRMVHVSINKRSLFGLLWTLPVYLIVSDYLKGGYPSTGYVLWVAFMYTFAWIMIDPLVESIRRSIDGIVGKILDWWENR